MKLVYPNKKYINSYKQAYQEFIKNDVKTYHFDNPDEIDIIKKYYNYRHNINLKPGYVPMTAYWLVENDEFIGEISIRHQLTESLKRYGGHIGYAIRYSSWNKGYGTKMLSLALKKAKEMGLEKVLITCDDDNIGSARVMEKNGGVFADKIKNTIDGKDVLTRRYWFNLK